MIGRIVGVLAGAVIAITGYGMLKPATFAKYYDFSKLSLGPFAEYKTLVCWLIVAIGAAVALAALQRPSGGSGRRKLASPALFDSAEADAEPAHSPGYGPLNFGPEPEEESHDHGGDHGDDHQVEHHEVHAPEPAH